MALRGRSANKFTTNIWPGFVDAMTALLLVLIFVLSIFMIIQSMLRTTVTTQENELNELGGQIASLSRALGLEQQRTDQLDTALANEQAINAEQESLISSLTAERDTALNAAAERAARIASFETQVASLLAQNSDLSSNLATTQTALVQTQSDLEDTQSDLSRTQTELTNAEGQVAERDRSLADREAALVRARASITALEEANSREISQKEALQLALVKARDEIDESVEAARLAATQREALETMIADMRNRSREQESAIAAANLQVETLTEAAKSSLAQRGVMEALIAELRSDISQRDSQIAEAESTLKLADVEASDARAELSDKERALAQTLTLLSASREELEEARAALENADGQNAAINTRVSEMEAELSAAEEARLLEIAAAAELRKRLQDASAKLSEAEAKQLSDAAAAEALRERLKNADAELTAMTLNLEAQRKKAENTLTLLAAAEAAKRVLEDEKNSLSLSDAQALSENERQAALLAKSNQLLSQERQRSTEATRRLALLNEQSNELRKQLNSLQSLLDEANDRDAASQVQIDALGKNLNTALARVAAEQKNLAREQQKLAEEQRARADEQARIAELETAERMRLEEEALDLRNYRSEFFGRVRAILGDREGVQIQGDRFVFSSEVLFAPGSAELGAGGRAQIARVANVLRDVAGEIPEEINWILRVDGHTDNVPIGNSAIFADNWELSQARALSVVQYLTQTQGIPANRLAATGFGEFQPVDTSDTEAARARNRRIELKFTEK